MNRQDMKDFMFILAGLAIGLFVVSALGYQQSAFGIGI